MGGPIIPPAKVNVLIGSLPAARVTDKCVCVGPPDMIVKGSMTVLIGGLNAARLSDPTTHGGMLVFGWPTVLIGDMGGAGASGPGAIGMAGPLPAVDKPCLKKAAEAAAPFVKA